jgi:hypothetical protein
MVLWALLCGERCPIPIREFIVLANTLLAMDSAAAVTAAVKTDRTVLAAAVEAVTATVIGATGTTKITWTDRVQATLMIPKGVVRGPQG